MALVASALPADAQTTQPVVTASIGFAGVFKADSWAPIYVRVTDADAPRSATLELRTARGKLGHDVIARVATSQQPTTYTLYAPLGGLDGASLQLRDASGKLLRAVDLTGAAQQTSATNGGAAFGVAGAEADAQRVVNQLINDTGEFAAAGAVPPRLLPERVIGYSGIDCLVLPSLEADAIVDDVQATIVAWVRAGGIVITWPGSQAPTRTSPLIDALPATVGPPEAIVFDGHQTVGRRLVPREGVNAIAASNSEAAPILQRRLGLGQIVMLAFDPTRLPTTSPADRVVMWRRLTSGQLSMSPDDRRAGVFDPLVAQAVGEQQLTSADETGRRWLRTLLSLGLLAGLLLGPTELVLLAAAGRHPRTWYTIAGLAVTAGCGATLLLLPNAPASAQARINVRVEAADGLAASAALATTPDESMAVSWLSAGATPVNQSPAELRLLQREDGFAINSLTKLRGSTAKVRAIRFAGSTLHPSRIVADVPKSLVTNASPSAWDAFAVVDRDSLRIVPGSVPDGETRAFDAASAAAADDRSTRRIETGIERLAAEPAWAAILMDRRLAERLVRLLETESCQMIVSRGRFADGSIAFTIHVMR